MCVLFISSSVFFFVIVSFLEIRDNKDFGDILGSDSESYGYRPGSVCLNLNNYLSSLDLRFLISNIRDLDLVI